MPANRLAADAERLTQRMLVRQYRAYSEMSGVDGGKNLARNKM